jgi:hypothetical protein
MAKREREMATSQTGMNLNGRTPDKTTPTLIDSATTRQHNDESRGDVPTPLIVAFIPVCL